MYSPETQSKIEQWREKSIAGTLTLEDVKEYTALMREGRVSAAHASAAAKKRTKAKKEVKSAEQLLGELEGL